jgi:extracellular elastinolytic metalloproteinase
MVSRKLLLASVAGCVGLLGLWMFATNSYHSETAQKSTHSELSKAVSSSNSTPENPSSDESSGSVSSVTDSEFKAAAAGGSTTFQTDASDDEPLEVALAYLKIKGSELGLEADEFDHALVTDQYVSEHNGVTHIYLRQRHEGLEVANANININVAKDGSVINMGTSFVPNLDSVVNTTQPNITAIQATEDAAKHLGLNVLQTPSVLDSIGGISQEVLLSKSGISQDKIPAKLEFFAVSEEEVVLVWSLKIHPLDNQHYWDIKVDAVSGALVNKADWVIHENYHVYAKPLIDPAEGGRSIEVNPYQNSPSSASPFGWHDTDGAAGAEYTITRGNNTHAYEDSSNLNTSIGNEPDGGAGLVFDFPVDLSQPPATYMEASVSHLFYWNNILHDIHYEYGFDEVSGNFQANNYGNGGLGNDYVHAQAQDGSGFNNANMLTAPDGTSPRMQMYLGNRTSPIRDGSFDNMVVIHEYGHGISTRLTGGPSTVSGLQGAQSGGMGEGWSDWWGLVLTAKPGDTNTQARTVGTWLFGQAPDGPGIRPYPYSTDTGINPHTYADISGLTIPHGIGSVWCETLWEMYWNLVDTHGFDTDFYGGTGGNNIAMQLVMDGLKLQPMSPTFLDARDAILLADQVNNGGANQMLIWQAFAKRGMGFSAVDGGSHNAVVVTEAFDIPDDLLVTPQANLIISGPQGGPFTPSSTIYQLSNVGTTPVTWSAAKTEAWFDLSSTGGVLAAGATMNVTVSLNAAANSLTPGSYTDSVVFSNIDSGAVHTRDVALRIDTYASMPFTEDFESGNLATFWRSSGTAEYRIQVTSANGPHGGTYHATMDDSVNSSLLSRNELTLGIDLANYENVMLSFWAKDYGDEPHGPPTIPFTDGADFDGVAISADGTLWYEVQGLRNEITGTYSLFTVDLDAAVAAHGLSYNSTFRIRFNQYDGHSIATDGIAIDDITVTGTIADDLRINPEDNLMSSGFEGGPFSPSDKVFTLTNTGNSNMAWTAVSSSNWVDVAPVGGNLVPGGTTDVTVTINTNANGIAPGAYDSAITFNNITSGNSQTRGVQLTVDALPSPPSIPFNPVPTNGAALVPVESDLSWNNSSNSVYSSSLDAQSAIASITQRSESSGEADANASQIASVTYAWEHGVNSASSLDVAICGAMPNILYLQDVQTKLINSGQFNSVSIIQIASVTPTLSEMQAFDAAIVFSSTSYQNPATLGNVMADYVDGGGGVVCMMFESAVGSTQTSTFHMQGRWIAENYYALPRGAGTSSGSQQVLGTVFEPSHPILNNVTSFSGGSSSYRPATSVISAGSVLVADWSDGTPLVITKFINGSRRADLGFYPPSSDAAGNFWDASTDGAMLMANALTWVTGAESEMANYDVYFGTNSSSLSLIGTNLMQATVDPGLLEFDTTYYWQVIASNVVGIATGPIWQFTTASDIIQFTSATYSVDEAAGQALISVSRQNGSLDGVSVDYMTSNGTATAGFDYVATSGTLIFGPGELTKTFSIPILNDADGEADETVYLSLQNPSANVIIGTPDMAELTIADDDGVPVSLPYSLYDGDNYLWDVQRSGYINNGTSDAYDGGHVLSGFPSLSAGLLVGDRELIIGPAVSGNIETTRRIYVPSDFAYARFMEVVRNVGSIPVTHTVSLDTNLGSDGSTVLVGTSDGDAVFETNDHWIVTDDSDGTGDPTVLHVIGNDHGAVHPSSVSYYTGGLGYDYQLNLQPGETKVIMHFGAQNQNRSTALSKAPDLASLETDVLDRIPSGLRGSIVNFGMPYDLGITPNSALVSEGYEGGVFSPSNAVYTLSNIGNSNLLWTAGSAQPWIGVAPSGGVLTPGGNIDVEVSILSSADALPAGTYNGIVSFDSSVDQETQTRSVQLAVYPPPQPPVQPHAPVPADLGRDIPIDTQLTWEGAGSFSGFVGLVDTSATYNVYFGTNAVSLMQIGSALTNTTADPGLLDINTTYYWQVLASNTVGVTTGAVWQFTTWSSGPLDHFEWENVPSPQFINAPFSSTVRAKDSYGYVVGAFTGAVDLACSAGGGVLSTNILGGEDHSSSGLGTYTIGYEFTPNTNITVTHVRHYSGSKVSIWSDAGVLLASQAVTSIAGQWVETPLSTPLELFAGQAYRVGFYTGGGSFYRATNMPTTFEHGTIGSSYYSTSDAFPSSTTSGRYLVDLSYKAGSSRPILITPESVDFISGIWTGALTVLDVATNAVLTADDGLGHTGQTVEFDVNYVGKLTVLLPTNAKEADGVLGSAGQVHVIPPSSTDLIINLVSDDTSELTVPATVVIPAGATNVLFSPSVIDDADLDITQYPSVTASSPGYLSGSKTMAILDNETATLAVDIPLTVREGAGLLQNKGMIYSDSTPAVDVEVLLSLSQTNDIVLSSASATILAGETNALFSLDILDNRAIDGSRIVILGAAVNGWISGTNAVTVLDDENTNLIVRLPAMVVEGDGVLVGAGEVALSGMWPSNVLVALSSDDTSEMMVSNSVVIPTGETNAFFDLIVMDDAVMDGVQTGTVSASAGIFTGTNSSVMIQDNEALIQGSKWLDLNTNSIWDTGEPGLDNWKIFADINSNDVFDEGEPFDLTDASGHYAISVTSGQYRVGEVLIDDWMQTYPSRSGGSAYSNSLIELNTCYYPNILNYAFTNLPPAIGDGVLTVYAFADLNSSSEYLALEADGQSMGNLFVTGGAQQSGITTDVVLSEALLSGWLNDSEVMFTVRPSTGVNNLGANELRLTLQYPTASGMHAVDVGYGGIATNINFGNMITGLYINVSLPETATEGDGTVTGQLGLNYPAIVDTVVSLSSDAPASLVVTNGLLIPAGTSNIAFTAFVFDDVDLDGTQPVTVSASSPGYRSGHHTMGIHDNESAGLSLSLPQTTYEAAGFVNGAVIADAAPDQDVVVTLLSNNESEIRGTNAVIKAGQTVAFFDLAVEDDDLLDGVQTATITAHVENWTSSSSAIFVFDDENTKLTLEIPEEAREGDGMLTNAGMVSIAGVVATDVHIALSSSDPSEMSVPFSVTIPQGQSSVMFDLSIGDDLDTDGSASISILATSPGYVLGADIINISDNDLHHFLVGNSSDPKPAGTPFVVELTAENIDNEMLPGFTGSVSIMALSDRGSLPVVPASTTLVAGQWNGNVEINGIGDNVQLIVDDGVGHVGTGTVFNVIGPQIIITPSALTNTLVVAGESGTRTMVISNAGNADLEFLIQGGGEVQKPQDPSLVAHYPFDGNADDDTGNGYDGTVVGATPTTDRFGNADSAYDFNGSSDHINCGNIINGFTNFTVSAWVNIDSYTDGRYMGPWSQQKFSSPPGVCNYALYAGNQTSAPGCFGTRMTWSDVTLLDTRVGHVVPRNEWHLISQTYDGNEVRQYDNGVLINTTVSPGHMITNANDFIIGKTVAFPNGAVDINFFDGAIDDLRIYNRAISEGEIAELYNETDGDGLVAHYPFNGNADDETGNGYDGTVNGATLTSDRFGNANSAYHFDGNDYIDTVDFSVPETFSVSAWIDPDTVANGQCVIGKHTSAGANIFLLGIWDLDSSNSGTMEYSIHVGSQWVETVSATTGLQHLVAVVEKGSPTQSQVTLYKDGQQLFQSVIDQVVSATAGKAWTIGQDWDSSVARSDFFRGDIDDVRIYNRVLSYSEVLALYNESVSTALDGVAPILLHTDENNGIMAPDYAGDEIEWIPEFGRYLNRTAERWVDSIDEEYITESGAFESDVVVPPVVYQVDWDGPPHTLNQRTATGGVHAPSWVVFGDPTVVPSFGQLTSRPLELRNPDTTMYSYSQLQFDVDRSIKKYILAFDVQKIEGDALTILFDTDGGVRNVYLNSSITGSRVALPSISWNSLAKNRVEIVFDLETLMCQISVNDNPPVSGSIDVGATELHDIRISCSDQNNLGGVAIDNLIISTESVPPPPPTVPDIPSWLTVSPSSGTIPPGGYLSVNVKFDAAGTTAGEHIADVLNIISNDPSSSTNLVPVSMDVIGGGISVNPNALDFGNIQVGVVETNVFELSNSSTNSILVNLHSDNPYFELGYTNLLIQGNQILPITVHFNAQRLGSNLATVVCSPIGQTNVARTIDLMAYVYLDVVTNGEQVITFDPPSLPGGNRGISYYTEKGFWFETPSGMSHSSASSSLWPHNGTAYLGFLSGDQPLTVTQTNGVVFDAIQVDFAEYSSVYDHPKTIPVVGTKSDGSTVSFSFTTDGSVDGPGGAADFETVAFPTEFTDLVSLTISTTLYSMDNLTVRLPETPALFDAYLAWQNSHFPDSTSLSGYFEDYDSDGQNNRDEFITGMDPTDPDSMFMVKAMDAPTNGMFVISWDSVTGRVYSVYWQTNLPSGFQTLETGIRYPRSSYTDSVHSAEECGFYSIDVELDNTSGSGGSSGPGTPPSNPF